MAGQRRIRIDALPLLDDLDAREVLAALLEVRHGVFVDVLFQRQRQQRAEPLTLRALRDRPAHRSTGRSDAADRSTGTFNGPDKRSNSASRSFFLRITLQSMATVRMRWLSAMIRPLASKMRPRSGGISTVAHLGGRHALLVRRRLDTLQEPQPGAERTDQQHRHQRQHAETRACAYRSPWHHCCLRADRTHARSAIRVIDCDHSGIALHVRRLAPAHHRPSGTSSGLSTVAATADDRDDHEQAVGEPTLLAGQELRRPGSPPRRPPTRSPRRSPPATTADPG